MKYAEFQARDHFAQDELLAFAHGRAIDDPPAGFGARLPMPPMLMLDRITEIRRDGSRGRVVGERDVRLDDWFFQCHFLGDPVQPGCLGVDGVWQLLGFFCAWAGGLGAGRALGCGEVDFSGQIRPRDGCVRTEVDVRRFTQLEKAGAAMVIGDATLSVNGEAIYRVERARVGTFQGIAYPDYPAASPNSRGGSMRS
ncbi:MAG TPA: bifunctional 3-hydroxydecanoyl-ACP dehydratase/trans-2-decenoyl-ACP isomerase [Myxococcota bacterium]|nr:bifunctional 3-hydroxydecanoyl-ACP dehydratase/trans-2-decenoyl-ACP isomerase [Myxococcota bacterium]